MSGCSDSRQRTGRRRDGVGRGRLPAAGGKVKNLFGDADDGSAHQGTHPCGGTHKAGQQGARDGSGHAVGDVLRPIGVKLRQHGQASVMFATRVTPSVPRKLMRTLVLLVGVMFSCPLTVSVGGVVLPGRLIWWPVASMRMRSTVLV